MNETTTRKRLLPRAAALHDLSSFGRCALTVVIPTLSALGTQCIPVPTALLSTHTGGFSGMYFRDLEEYGAVSGIGAHFGALGLDFDAVYTGFLGSAGQVGVVQSFIDTVSRADPDKKPLIFVDPVMGDDGVMYSACIPELVGAMRELIAGADVITPNLTETCLLAGEPYTDTSDMTTDEAADTIRRMIGKISAYTAPHTRVIVTGIPVGGRIGTCAAGRFFFQRRRTRAHPGTGDIFASVVLGRLLACPDPRHANDAEVADAAEFASAFTAYTMDFSVRHGADEPSRDGVLLEGCLDRLILNRKKLWREDENGSDKD